MISASDVARESGVKYHTLMYWLRRGWVEAKVYERRQWAPVLFSAAQVEQVRGLAEMKRRHAREWNEATGR